MNAAGYETPTRALLAEVHSAEDIEAVLAALDEMLLLCDSWGELTAAAFRHANGLLLDDADAPQARGWFAFVRELSIVDAVLRLEVEAEGLLEDVPTDDYDEQ